MGSNRWKGGRGSGPGRSGRAGGIGAPDSRSKGHEATRTARDRRSDSVSTEEGSGEARRGVYCYGGKFYRRNRIAQSKRRRQVRERSSSTEIMESPLATRRTAFSSCTASPSYTVSPPHRIPAVHRVLVVHRVSAAPCSHRTLCSRRAPCPRRAPCSRRMLCFRRTLYFRRAKPTAADDYI